MSLKPPEAARRRPLSLALRLTALIGLLIAGLLIAFGWLIENSIEHHFEAQDAQELAALAHAVQEALDDGQGETDLAALQRRFAQSSVGHHGLLLYVAQADGEPLFASSTTVDWDALARQAKPLARIVPESLELWRVGEHSYRGAVLHLGKDRARGNRPYLAVVAKSMDFHMDYLAGLQRALLATILTGILITIPVLWWAVHQGHAPLRRITAQMRRIDSERMHVRLLPQAVPIELAELAASFNAMLERIEEVLTRLSNFSDDIAHELRTPVTNLMTQTQVALSNARGVDEYREILYSNLEEYERMAQMIGDMLFLAKGDNGQLTPNVTDVDLVREVRELFEYFDAWAEERGVRLTLDGGEAMVTGDRLMLRRAISNLLSNAIRHTAPGSAVRVGLKRQGEETQIEVENPAAEIPPRQLQRLFDRFYRMEPSRHRNPDGEGAGLGLAIVQSIANAHGGSVEAGWSDGVIRFCIRLPRRA